MPQTREHQESMAKVVCELLSAQAEMEPDLPGVDSSAGAILDFRGVVRGLENGRAIEGIDYEAHETMAQSQLERIGNGAAEEFGLRGVLIRHRIGFVAAGDASLLVRLTSAHRAESLKAMVWLIDELKRKVPIWKHPRFGGVENSAASAAAEVVR
jgi:molybdopterin synthase catalytic subunit